METGDFTRSHSSDEVLWDRGAPVPIPKTPDLLSSSKSSRTKFLRRSHTYSVLSMYRQGTDSDKPVTSFSKIIEKRESLTEDTEKDGEEKVFTESFPSLPVSEDDDDEIEVRNKSIQKLRGILKIRLKADAIVRSIKFQMEDQDKMGDNKEFPKKIKKQLRSPPPCDLYLRHKPPDTETPEDCADDDTKREPTSELLRESAKSRAHLSFFTNVGLSSSDYQLQEKYHNYESSFCDFDEAKKVFGLLPTDPNTPNVSSPLPRDVELSELERKSIQRRLSVKPSFIRFVS